MGKDWARERKGGGMRLSRKQREDWRRIGRVLNEDMRRFRERIRPVMAEINRGAAMFADATWPLRYADDICESHGEVEDVFV